MRTAALLAWFCLAGCDCGTNDRTNHRTRVGPPNPNVTEDPRVEAPLYIDPTSIDFHANPHLLTRLREHPHNYFRFIRGQFATEVCRSFDSADARSPQVNLHGDAHLEQYAVSDLGRGLTDFDGATAGPAVLDLVRMGVSIRMTCELHGWDQHEVGLRRAFHAGYRVGVDLAPDVVLPSPPSVAVRMRESFSNDRVKWLELTDALVDSLSPDETEAARRTFQSYADARYAEDPQLDPNFFHLVSIGRLDMGIGSALDEKYLIRVRGPTNHPDDDEILEAKEVHSIADIPCVGAADALDPFRILVGESRIAYRPFPFLGYVRASGKVFWIHGWTTNYREFSVERSIETPEELRALLGDIGLQLGRGHVNRIAAPLDDELRRAVIEYLDAQEPGIEQVVVDLGDRTLAAWERFRAATEGHPALRAEPIPAPTAFHE